MKLGSDDCDIDKSTSQIIVTSKEKASCRCKLQLLHSTDSLTRPSSVEPRRGAVAGHLKEESSTVRGPRFSEGGYGK